MRREFSPAGPSPLLFLSPVSFWPESPPSRWLLVENTAKIEARSPSVRTGSNTAADMRAPDNIYTVIPSNGWGEITHRIDMGAIVHRELQRALPAEEPHVELDGSVNQRRVSLDKRGRGRGRKHAG